MIVTGDKTMRSIVATLVCFWSIEGAFAQSLELKYSTDFTSDPQWVTDQPDNYKWDALTQTSHAHVLNAQPTPPPTRYAYTTLDYHGGAFRLEFDARPIEIQWSAGVGFGLYDSTLDQWEGGSPDSQFANVFIGAADQGLALQLMARGGNGQSQAPSFWNGLTEGTWYHFRLEYESASDVLKLTTTVRETGALIGVLETNALGGLSPGLNRLGFARDPAGVCCRTTGCSGYGCSQTATENIDNVQFFSASGDCFEPAGQSCEIDYEAQRGRWTERGPGACENTPEPGARLESIEVDVPSVVEPGEEITFSINWNRCSDCNPDAVIYSSVLGDWEPAIPLYVSGAYFTSCDATSHDETTFAAPTAPGTYRIRWIMCMAFQSIDHFCGEGPPGPSPDPGSCPYVEVSFQVCPSEPECVAYATDFSYDPGWTTNVPQQMSWDEATERYYIESRAGADQYVYTLIPAIGNQSFQLEYDLTMVRADYAGAISIGLSDGLDMWGETNSVWVNYGRGDGGTGATVGFRTGTEAGNFPGSYDFLYQMDTKYHYVITYDSLSQMLHWKIYLDGQLQHTYHSAADIGSFPGLDRLVSQNNNNGGGTAAGYLDNLKLALFSTDCDADGVPNSEDKCPNTDDIETVVINDCDTGVKNDLFDYGCSMLDLIAGCEDETENHGQFVRCVGRLAREWRQNGLITNQERASIIRCVVRIHVVPVDPYALPRSFQGGVEQVKRRFR